MYDNPGIGPKDALDLSEKMMNGHKMELFKLHLSFIGWHILGILTLVIFFAKSPSFLTSFYFLYFPLCCAQYNLFYYILVSILILVF